ncbi:pyrroline-5-carboxylate reductase family protein, partial [Streptomyces sp. NPDC002559]
DSGEHPVKLREAVTSPAGTTISAIRELENHGAQEDVLRGKETSTRRFFFRPSSVLLLAIGYCSP